MLSDSWSCQGPSLREKIHTWRAFPRDSLSAVDVLMSRKSSEGVFGQAIDLTTLMCQASWAVCICLFSLFAGRTRRGGLSHVLQRQVRKLHMELREHALWVVDSTM